MISGMITWVGPPSAPDDYQNVYQDIVITDDNNQTTEGRIGSKRGYQPNTRIEVTAEEKTGDNGPYLYFKRVQSGGGQYQGGGQHQGGGRKSKQDNTDWDKIGRGKTRCALAGAMLQAGNKVDKPYIDELVPWIFGDPQSQVKESQRAVTDRQAEEAYAAANRLRDNAPTFDADNPDDIPF